VLSSAVGQKISFPGSRSETKSPNGRYVIQNVDSDQPPAHTLILMDMRNGSTNTVYKYARHVDVLWSPSSDATVINDYEGSNASRPILITLPWTAATTPLDLRENLIDFLRSKGESKIILGNDHSYLLAQRWLSSKEILCELRVYGEANPKGAARLYVYTIGEGFKVFDGHG
jgi:hypothetical protein